LENHVIGPAVIEDERKPIEILDATLQLAAVHHPDRDDELLAAHVVEKHVLNVRLCGLRFRGGRHVFTPGARAPRFAPEGARRSYDRPRRLSPLTLPDLRARLD